MKQLTKILAQLVTETAQTDGQKRVGNVIVMWRIIPLKDRCPQCNRKLGR